jgi:hypothetical protein
MKRRNYPWTASPVGCAAGEVVEILIQVDEEVTVPNQKSVDDEASQTYASQVCERLPSVRIAVGRKGKVDCVG